APHSRTDYTDYVHSLRPDALRGARLGIPREVYFGFSEKTDAIAEEALAALRAAGAGLVDPANIPTAKQMQSGGGGLVVVLYEFKADLNTYLAALGPEAPVHSLEELLVFNETHAEQEMPYFKQELLVMAQTKGPLTEQAYLEALETNRRLARQEGI